MLSPERALRADAPSFFSKGPHEEQAQRALVSEEDGHEEINAGGGGSEANAPPSASLATAPEARGPSAQVPAAVADADTAVLDSCDLPPMIVNPDSFLYDESGTYVWSVERVKAAWAEAKKAWAFYLELQPKRAVLLMGMPGSGKSTWLAANQRPNVVYFDATFDSAWKRVSSPLLCRVVAVVLVVCCLVPSLLQFIAWMMRCCGPTVDAFPFPVYLHDSPSSNV